MTKKKSLAHNPSYRNFVTERDRALEVLLLNAQLKITDLMNAALNQITEKLAAKLAMTRHSVLLRHEIDAADRVIDQALAVSFPAILHVQMDLERKAKLLAHASETEAIGRALRKPKEFRIATKQHDYNEMQDRIGSNALALDRLRRKILDAYQSARTEGLDVSEGLDRIKRAYPKLKKFKRGPKTLKPISAFQEADDSVNPKEPYSFGIMDEETWNELVDEYKNAYLPKTRGPDSVFDVPDENGTLTEYYGWEIEQNMNDDFVRAVRDGQNDAAAEQGITDMVWLAVLDSSTDECCIWRDGLTSAEIEDRLNSDKAGDECDALVPPAHFGCRCSQAPITDETPSDAPYNPDSFENWLTQ